MTTLELRYNFENLFREILKEGKTLETVNWEDKDSIFRIICLTFHNRLEAQQKEIDNLTQTCENLQYDLRQVQGFEDE